MLRSEAVLKLTVRLVVAALSSAVLLSEIEMVGAPSLSVMVMVA